MTKLSTIRLDSKHLGFFLNSFWSLITLLENKDQVKSFLKDLLTHTEMKMLAKRIQIAKMLLEGYDYRAIRNYVKVTDPTISKISNILATDGEGLKTAVGFLQKIESQIEKRRFSGKPLKERYGMYFLPDKLIDAAGKKLKSHNKKLSAGKNLSV